MDIPNEIAKSGHIYFPEFCKLVLDRFRHISDFTTNIDGHTILTGWHISRKGGTEDDLFRQNMFKVLLFLKMLCIKIHHSLSSNQNLSFQMMCGTDPFPKDFKAKKYRQAAIDVRKALFVHSVCAFGLNTHSVCTNFSLNTHSVCTNFGLIVHSPVYSVILLK